MADWGASRAFYDSKFWRELSYRVRVRDKWTCNECHTVARSSWDRRKLQAHHLISRPHVSYPTPLDCAGNLITLCCDCHRRQHGLRPVGGSVKSSSYACKPTKPQRALRAGRAPRAVSAMRFNSGRPPK